MPASHDSIAARLVGWYHNNARSLPWRETRDPYRIWVSEIILQQTTVAQGLEYYLRFISRFPDVGSLARSDEKDVLKAWEGLGYYSRARNLHASARHIVNSLESAFPKDYSSLLALKGVGPYTAAAIASFAYDLPHAVVDGNVIRVISRMWGISEPVGQSRTQKKIQSIAQDLIENSDPYLFNQAIMEFGALQCIPRNPDCGVCPFNKSCLAFAKNKVHLLPVKEKARKKRVRHFHYTVITTPENKTIISQRKKKDIWRGLYEFPMQEVDPDAFDNYQAPVCWPELSDNIPHVSEVYRQELSHQTIYSRFYRHILKKGVFLQEQKGHDLVPIKQLKSVAFPKTSCLYLSDISITLV